MSITSSFWRLHSTRTLFVSVAICGLLFVLGGNKHASATNYFNWDVETLQVSYGVNGPGTFTVSPFNATTIINDANICHKSSHCVQMPVYGSDGGNQQLGVDMIQQNPNYSWTVVGGRSMYYRAWVKFSSGFNWGAVGVAKVKTERAFVSTSLNRLISMHMRGDAFLIAECEFVSGYGGGCLTTGGVPNNDYNIKINYNMQAMADGKWHEYIVRIKPNSTPSTQDAEFQVWVDGVSVGQLSGWLLSTDSTNRWHDAWGGWMVTPYFQMNGNSSDGGTVWTDDFSVDDVFNSIFNAVAPTGVNVR